MQRSPQSVGTPFYCYSTATLERHYRVFADAFADVPSLVCYAMKANSNQAVIATLARLGAGVDVVSGGELKRALAAGIPPEKIMFSGVGKTARRARRGGRCRHPLHQRRIRARARRCCRRSPPSKGRTVCVSLRVNPDVDAKTHAKIATGKSENKFGIPISRARDVYAQAGKLDGRARRRRRHAYRQPDHRAAAVRRCLRAALRFRAHAARRRPSHRACRSRRRARHSVSRGQRAAARSGRLCGGGRSARRAISTAR